MAANALVSPDLKTTSLVISDRFGKRHADVLRSIDNLEIPSNFRERNFAFRESVDRSPFNGLPIRTRVATMTRDGFALVVMGFTGKKAMEWKIKFLEAFNAMEAELRVRAQPANQPLRLTAPMPSPKARALENSLAHWQAIHAEAGKRVAALSAQIAKAAVRPAAGATGRLYGSYDHHEDEDLALSLAPWEAAAPLSPGQRYEIRAAVQARLHSFGVRVQRDDYLQAWSALNAAMGVRSYRDIPQARFAEALAEIAKIGPFA